MSRFDHPCLKIAIAPLSVAQDPHFAMWVLQAPYLSGYVHHDSAWSEDLAQLWHAWQQLFSLQSLPSPLLPKTSGDFFSSVKSNANNGYSSLLMQKLGLNLWQWLFSGSIARSFAQSQGIAMGQDRPLRLRLDLRSPYLIDLPWEILQPQPGKSAVSLSQHLLFSRTTSEVESLSHRRATDTLNILLVLGQEATERYLPELQLEQEAKLLSDIFDRCALEESAVPYRVQTLIQPTVAELIDTLESQETHILLYAGHGIPSPDGGRLFLGSATTLSGTELAQVLVQTQVTLAVFNSCWGAQSARNESDGSVVPRSSLAEVLIHHGVPAVLAMRDTIADREALSFIRSFAQALAKQHPIDRAISIARQQLLTLYKFNQPAWTLPVLYMHPEFDGCLIPQQDWAITELPSNSNTWLEQLHVNAYLRSIDSGDKIWPIRSGLLRVGRTDDNDLTIPERWVSKRHAEIFSRHLHPQSSKLTEPMYYLRDFSRYGTLVLGEEGWRKIHHQEVLLRSGVQIKFGSSHGQAVEFRID
jgi:CHAT domain/FHA domain